MNDNPWLVNSLQDFAFLHCPECHFMSKEDKSFQYHATESHPLSYVFFGENFEQDNLDFEDKKPEILGNLPKLSTEEKIKPFKCDFCEASFSKNSNLKTHVETIHEKIKYVCERCPASYGRKYLLTKHIKNVHSTSKIKEEHFEIDKFNTKENIGNEIIASNFVDVDMSESEYDDQNSDNLDNYPKTSKIKQELYEIDELNDDEMIASNYLDITESEYDLEEYSINPEGENPENNLICPVCQTCHENQRILNMHIKEVHDKLRKVLPINIQIKCSFCQEIFKSFKVLLNHCKSVHEGKKPKKPFICVTCSKEFVSKRNLDGHLDKIHDGKMPFKCNLCDLRFSTGCSLSERFLLSSIYPKYDNRSVLINWKVNFLPLLFLNSQNWFFI